MIVQIPLSKQNLGIYKHGRAKVGAVPQVHAKKTTLLIRWSFTILHVAASVSFTWGEGHLIP